MIKHIHIYKKSEKVKILPHRRGIFTRFSSYVTIFNKLSKSIES